MAPQLTPELQKAITELYRRYETRESVIMPALHLIQDTFGYISESVADELAEFMQIPRVRIEECLSFYTMYHRHPVGKYHFQICTNITCCMFDSRKLRDRIKAQAGLTQPKTISEDGLFSYEEVACLGSCGTAPVVMINNDYHESFSSEDATHVIEKAKQESHA